MNKEYAEKITAKYLKAIYGFSVKHCRTLEDAEDLSQEIIFKAFIYLMQNNDIENESKLIWTIAHNCLCNYYRDNSNCFVGLPIYDFESIIADDETNIEADLIMNETIDKLQSEIAYLSKLQRQIIISYYFEHKKQKDIASELSIPIGTVKWHLFEAKKELKKGMDTMRNYGELKFNPIKFEFFGHIGTVGKGSNILDSALAQNIVYCVFREAKSINQIAEELGVSPVYIESEVERLEEYCYITQTGEKYLCNILIDEPTEKIVKMSNEMYSRAAKIFANELYDELINSDIWENINISGGFSDISISDSNAKYDKNFFMWALIPYIASLSGKFEFNIAYDEVATRRPDGSYNICYATILSPDVVTPYKIEDMKSFFGPCYQENDTLIMQRNDSAWSGKRIDLDDNERAFTLLNQYVNDIPLSNLEYAFLAEQGYITTFGSADELFRSSFQASLLMVTIQKTC